MESNAANEVLSFMDNDQLEKKVKWLEAGRLEFDKTLAQLEKRLAGFEAMFGDQKQAIQSLHKEIPKLTSAAAKIDELAKDFKADRLEVRKELQAKEKESKQNFQGIENKLSEGQKSHTQSFDELRKRLSELHLLEKEFKARSQVDTDLAQRVDQLNKDVEVVLQGEGERNNLTKSMEATQSKMDKGIAEMRGEVSAVLKHMEQAAAKVEQVDRAQSKVQAQFAELVTREEEQRTKLREFMQSAAADQVKREREWGEWLKRFESLEELSAEITQRLQQIETVDLAMKRAQRAYDELVGKIDRRVNEIGEVQRLGEQRFRQEWSTFQSDAQKRWTGFLLEREEHQQEATRQRKHLAEQILEIEEKLQDIQDTVQHLSDQNERYLQLMLEAVRDTLAEKDRFFSNTR